MDEAGFLSDDGSLTSAHSQKELQELQELQEQGPIHLTPSPNIVVLNFEQDSAITLPIPIEQQKRKRTYRINGTNLLNKSVDTIILLLYIMIFILVFFHIFQS